MKLHEQNILFFTRAMGSGGTENVILQLCHTFQPLANKIVVCSCGGVNVDKLHEIGVKHYPIPDIESKSPGVIFRVARSLRRIVRDEKITVIHTHHRMAAFYDKTSLCSCRRVVILAGDCLVLRVRHRLGGYRRLKLCLKNPA